MEKPRGSQASEGKGKALFPELFDTNPRLPLCAALARGKHSSELVVVHHLHETALPYIRNLADGYEIRRIVGIPYSAVSPIVDQLRERFKVTVPNSIEEIKHIVRAETQATSRRVIIDEIGGYSTQIAPLLDANPLVAGVVEDTNQGHWLWEQAKLNRLPVLSIAQSRLKKVENPFVGKGIVYGVSKFLSENGLADLAERKVLVIGYGNVGSEVARNLRPLAKRVFVYDTDPLRRLQASEEFEVTRDFSAVDTVIGTTGNPSHSISADDIKSMNPRTILFSGSSKRVEFDLAGFEKAAESIQIGNNLTRFVVERKEVLLANSGEPINFRYAPIPSNVLDLVYGSLVHCINLLDEGKVRPGLNPISEEDQIEVARRYESIYGQNALRKLTRRGSA